MRESSSHSLSIVRALRDESEAAIEMLERAIRDCPDDLWDLREDEKPFWHKAYHTIYFLDLYMTDPAESFEVPSVHVPELEKLAETPSQALSRAELEDCFQRAKAKFGELFDGLIPEALGRKPGFSGDETLGHALLENLRHVQHHVGQMYSFLRRKTGNAPKWVSTVE